MEKAYKEAATLTRQVSDLTLPTPERPATPETDILIETGKRLGISTEEETKAQISDEIVKAKTSG